MDILLEVLPTLHAAYFTSQLKASLVNTWNQSQLEKAIERAFCKKLSYAADDFRVKIVRHKKGKDRPMAKINRSIDNTPTYSVGVNIVASGTKTMSENDQDIYMKNEPDLVNIFIADANDPTAVLMDVVVPLEVFTSGNVGYKFHIRGKTFHPDK